jgi:hypothetical protein
METKEIINQFVDDVLDGNSLAAKEAFQNAISIKVSDAIEQKKVEVAQSVYNNDAASKDSEQDEDTKE